MQTSVSGSRGDLNMKYITKMTSKVLIAALLIVGGESMASAATGVAAARGQGPSVTGGPDNPNFDPYRKYGRDICRSPGASRRAGCGGGKQDAQVCFYTGSYFRGAHFCVDAGVRNPRLSRRWNDRISSIRVIGTAKAEVCSETHLSGRCILISSSRTILNSMDNSISSFATRH